MRRIGLTGGIGSGKSTVARLLAEHGAHVIDADAIAREVVAPGTPGLAEVAAAFPGVLSADGSLDRPALAAIVFADADARVRLEQITHPRIGAETARRIEMLPPGAVCVYDVPLLVEAGLQQGYDLVVVVEAPLEVRLRRLAERGLPAQQARERIAHQATDEQRREVADVLIANGGDLDALREQVRRAWPVIAGTA
ncbi:MAG TPA: dephospho-CoA kinase [Mycobacteriales bacterium]|jgi:dephospho-CoA kinase|nr:dephospho-CoA kinase [Mycobacteriales bacterium]